MNQSTAKLRHLRVAPRKVRMVVELIRGKSVKEALNQLYFSKRHAALPVKKLIESAVANAVHNHDLDEESLQIKTVFVDEGKTLYRWMPRAFGRATPIRKRTSHITLILEGENKNSVSTTKVEEVESEEVKEESKK